MFNPLLPDLSKIKNDDLELRITDLMKKYTVASRLGQGGVCAQINVILESYRIEQRRRYDLESQKLAQKNKNLDDLINVD
jgi:hypothetical protein